MDLPLYNAREVCRLEKIGRGTFWKVYDGKLLGNECAIKMLRGIKESVGPDLSKVVKECTTWASLRHPNITRLHGIYYEAHSNLPLLIIEWMDGNLAAYLKSTHDTKLSNSNQRFPLPDKLSILMQVAGAMEYLHTDKKVIHGDLTANNVLLKGSHVAKLTDFGMTRALDDHGFVISTGQGTYNYMSPEVHNGCTLSTKADIYSFGVLCVNILSHKTPKPSHAVAVDSSGCLVAISEFRRYQHYLLDLSDIERHLEPLIQVCLEYLPENRPNPQALLEQLKHIHEKIQNDFDNISSSQSQEVHQFFGTVVSGCTISDATLQLSSLANMSSPDEPLPRTLCDQ